ncbi:MAG: pyridoxamine 5'-phosphate oxidase family protein [Lachnospiraceae bacterium]|nr:pyridoxamine 5'-phosphate oxidase family protein [Lachnospiraceae bacterium]
MRRKDREITNFNKILEIVEECDIIRLGLADGDFPYIVPVNFAYENQNGQLYLYLHGAKAGRKYELLKRNPHCSFEMDIPLQMDCIVEKKDVTMRYRSVMGKAEIEFLEGEEKQRAIDDIIMNRYDETRHFDYNRKAVAATAVIKLKVMEITGKQNPPNGGSDC